MEEEDRLKQDSLVDAAGDLIETYRNLITMRIVEQTSLGASVSILGIIVLVVTLLILLFAGLGAAWWIGDALHNMKAGFFIVGGFYVLVLIISMLVANSVIIPGLRNLIIRKIYEQD
ncbi:MAG TPA: hypothetical protein VK666_00695 [Chryseolinea sp.]|nr:hypothetical protein [Chryseolinea sp.]